MEAGIAELEFYTKAVPSDQEEEGGGGRGLDFFSSRALWEEKMAEGGRPGLEILDYLFLSQRDDWLRAFPAGV